MERFHESDGRRQVTSSCNVPEELMRKDWGDEELAAAIDAYNEMTRARAEKKAFSKRETYRNLAARFGRTEKAFEYRMQNISAVLAEMGLPWLAGLPPASNVGVNVKPRIAALLHARGRGSLAASSASYRANLSAIRDWLVAVARTHGKVTYGDVMKVFGIDRFSLRHAMDHLGHESLDRKEPIITALIVNAKSRRCSIGLANEFGVRDDEAERERLYEFWSLSEITPVAVDLPSRASLETRAARFASVEVRPDQAAFRRKVFLSCKGCCVVSGCSVSRALDAAHRMGRDWRRGHNKREDGYLLRKDLHALYDARLLRITAGGIVRLDPSVHQHYSQFSGMKVKCAFTAGNRSPKDKL